MQRMFGMMPSDEIKKTGNFIDCYDKIVVIEAGEHGWTVIYADCSTSYKDVDATVEENYEEAYKVAESNVGPFKK